MATQRTYALVLAIVLISVGVGLWAAPSAPAQDEDCEVPHTQTVRTKDVTFDECHAHAFSHDGEDYTVHVFFTTQSDPDEEPTQTNLAQCTAAENSNNRCDHVLADDTDADGNNIHAVGYAEDVELVWRFLIDHDVRVIRGGDQHMDAYAARDPRSGGVVWPGAIYLDRRRVDGDPITDRLRVTMHEIHHLTQFAYYTGWTDKFYGEGFATATEARFHPGTTGRVINQIDGLLGSASTRQTSIDEVTYDTAAFWTWLADEYREAGETVPDRGWGAIRDYYFALEEEEAGLPAGRALTADRGVGFEREFTDYTLALAAYEFVDPDHRLGFLDPDVTTGTGGLRGHPTRTGAPSVDTDDVSLDSRTSRYLEIVPDASCEFASYGFDSDGTTFDHSVLTVGSDQLQQRWTSRSTDFDRTVHTAGLDRLFGVVSAFDDSGDVDITSGCVDPEIEIKRPTTAAFATVGDAANPRNLVVRLRVRGPEGDPVAGLQADAFDVDVVTPGGAALDAEVLTAAYVQDDYWLLVSPPDAADGAQDATFHDLEVGLGNASDSQAQSVLYVERTQDAVTVLDISFSMNSGGRIEAARNAASLLVGELGDDDQGGLVTFDTDARVVEGLAPVGTGGHRDTLEEAIAAQTPTGTTTVGGGLQEAAAEEAANGNPEHACSFVLLSDGYENSDPMWDDVRGDVVDNGCAVHAIAFGPSANETLLQSIAGDPDLPGGSFDYADTEGEFPVNAGGTAGASGTATTASADPGGTIGWENHLARVYDAKATEMAGRDRVYSAGGMGASECGDETTTVDFEDVPLGTYPVGDGFTSNGVEVTLDEYASEPGEPFADGDAEITDTSPMDSRALWTRTVLARHHFEGTGCRVTFEYTEQQPISVNLWVNGEREIASNIPDLDGATVGGVDVDVDFQPDVIIEGTDAGDDTEGAVIAQPVAYDAEIAQTGGSSGTVTLEGPIGSFGVGGDNELFIDDVVHERAVVEAHQIHVDETSQELVVAMAWQHDEGHPQETTLRDPDGNAQPGDRRSRSANGTHEVWRVPDPAPGTWTFEVDGLGQEHVLNASAVTDHRLHLLTGTPVEDRSQGAQVPILAVVEGPGGPIPDAEVRATVRDPDGRVRRLRLHDDGGHGDGEAGNGVYGGTYTATSFGTEPADRPDEGDEPESVGSYLVDAVSIVDDVRREAQASFAIAEGADSNDDGIPDRWKDEHDFDIGLPPDFDFDGDGLPIICEYQAGTNPRTSDSSGGGESDFAYVTLPVDDPCFVDDGRDPLDPDLDRIGPLGGARVHAEAPGGVPELVVEWDPPTRGELVSVDLHRRPTTPDGEPDGDYALVADDLGGNRYVDDDVADGQWWQYRLHPTIRSEGGDELPGRLLETSPAQALVDPYPPIGSIVIDDGAGSTSSRTVTLSLGVDDLVAGHGDPSPEDDEEIVGSPADDIEMRLSNDGDFDGPWQPFAAEVDGWEIADDVAAGERATVYVQFRDEAGNVSDPADALGQIDSILYAPSTRFSGTTRIETAIDVSRGSFDDGRAVAAVLARADAFPDALAGTPLATAKGGPLLLTNTDSLHSGTAAELQRLLRQGRSVYLLGGTAALDEQVADDVAALGFEPVRLSGPTRVETSIAIAEELGSPDPLLVTTGFAFPDALAAGSAASAQGGAVLLTSSEDRHPATDAYLDQHPDAARYAVGGPAARPYDEATPLFGAGREETAVAVAEAFFPRAPAVGLARSDVFADALSGGPHSGKRRAPILLTPTDFLHPATEAHLCSAQATLAGAFVYGGTAAITDGVFTTAGNRLSGDGCD